MAIRVGWPAAPRCATQEAAVVVVDFSRKYYRIGFRAAPKQWRSVVSTVSPIARNATRHERYNSRRFPNVVAWCLSAGTSGTDATAYVCRVLLFIRIVAAPWKLPTRPESPY
jgi:hypothetical protein